AIGVILYESITGRRPFVADAMPRLMVLIHEGKPAPPKTLRASIPDALETLILDAMKKDRDARVPKVEALAERLRPFTSIQVSIPPSSAPGDAPAATNLATGEAMATTALASVRAPSAISAPEKTQPATRPWVMAAIVVASLGGVWLMFNINLDDKPPEAPGS